jgi:hypothetical protein
MYIPSSLSIFSILQHFLGEACVHFQFLKFCYHFEFLQVICNTATKR